MDVLLPAGYTGTLLIKNNKLSDVLGELQGDEAQGDYSDAIASQPFQPVVSPSAGWMASANLSMPRAGVPAGPPALVQPPVTAAFLKHPRTPPGGGPGLEYHMAESEHLMKRARLGPSDEVCNDENQPLKFHGVMLYFLCYDTRVDWKFGACGL
ncbi:hypothetical protein L2E82_39527 [Cichorium intybus]|uniref:Uncharacterized protein n=1 Tax=Cichorium intybus TaxID=13427 RepID=A0ACB9AIF8_CICIN|nr:hypothetical protein L2E82_39527 [Cichorium intybus]